jgi:hypothetical protein
MRVFESFGTFLNEFYNEDKVYTMFKTYGGKNIERKPAYTSDLFGSNMVQLKDAQQKELDLTHIPVYTSKDVFGKMAPKGIYANFANTPNETIFILWLNHEQGEFKDYYGRCIFVDTQGADYVRYGFGMDYEPDLSKFAMGVPESLENEVEIEGEIDEAKGYNMEDIRYAMQQVFSEVGFDKALKRISKVKGGFQMNMSSYMSPSSLEGYGMIKMFSEIMGHEFKMDIDSFTKGSITSIVILEGNQVSESKITLKRRYTDNHPQITVSKFGPVRDKIIEAIADGKVTAEEFETIIKEFSTASRKWAKSNRHYFNVSEDGISLSKYGQRILSKIKAVNENE